MYVLTLVCLAVFYFGVRVKGFHLAAFLVLLVVIITVIVVLDIKANSLAISFTQGKLTKLDTKYPELLETINKEWDILSKGRKPLNCYIMRGNSGHSNCFVDMSRVVIYDSMFEHVREPHHMMGIIRHEMGHAIHHHVIKIILMRILYYDLFFIGTTFLVKYQEKWLPMFGVSYDSVFLCIFIIIHFVHYKVVYFIYDIIEKTVQRGFEYFADRFAVINQDKQTQEHFREAMLIVF
jgi:Zn-dependent protease with chaperone function